MIETLENSAKYVQSFQQKHQNEVTDFVLVPLLLSLNILHTFFHLPVSFLLTLGK